MAGSPAEAVAGAEIVISMLSDPIAVAQVAEAAKAGAVGRDDLGGDVHHRPRRRHARLRGLAALRDVALIDAPVLGTVGPATEGKLRVIAGGETADFERVQGVLGVFGTVHHYGELGAGSKMKLAVMAGQLSVQVLMAENLAYVQRLGLSTSDYFDLLDATLLGTVGERLRPVVEDGVPETRFKLALAAKDLTLATEGPGEVQTLTAAGARPVRPGRRGRARRRATSRASCPPCWNCREGPEPFDGPGHERAVFACRPGRRTCCSCPGRWPWPTARSSGPAT